MSNTIANHLFVYGRRADVSQFFAEFLRDGLDAHAGNPHPVKTPCRAALKIHSVTLRPSAIAHYSKCVRTLPHWCACCARNTFEERGT
jgi:hypothetical protein